MRSSTFRREPRKVRARSSVSGGTERRPSAVSITTANTAIRKAIAIFGSAPVPNQMMNSGASATLGTLLSATNSGNSSRSSSFHSTMTTANRTPNTVATAKPAIVMPRV